MITSKIIWVTSVFILLYFVFYLQYPYNIFVQDIFLVIILIILTKIAYIHLVNIHLTFYRISLKSIFSETSKIYKILSRGFIVKVFTLLFSIYFISKILIILSLINVYIDQYIVLYFSILIYFYFYYKNTKYNNINTSFLRDDISSLVNLYYIPYIVSIFSVIIITIYEVFLSDLFVANSLADIFDKAVETVNPEHVYPLRVFLRHFYALDLMTQQLIQIQFPWGIFIYFLFLIIFGSTAIYFSAILPVLPINKKK